MEKLMNLYDFEFKRNRRNYFLIIGTTCTLLIVKLIMNLSSFNYIINKMMRRPKFSDNLKGNIGILSFDNLLTNEEVILFLIGILVCILYSIIIWNKDFIGKNKSIYTLYMLPQNKINIYISKFLNIICLIYMYTISFVLTLFVAYKIMPFMMKGNVNNFGFVQSTIDKFFAILPYSFNSFIYKYIVIAMSTISLVFMIILFLKYISIFKMKNWILIILMITYIVFILYKVYLSYIGFAYLNMLICTLTIIINVFISNQILNRIEL